MTFSDSDATRIIAALDARAERKFQDGAQVSSTWATISAVDAYNKEAAALLYGESDSAYQSEGFRIPEAMYLSVGDKVKVAINYSTGERWIEEQNFPETVYKKITVGLDGTISFGSGTAAADVTLDRATTGRLCIASTSPSLAIQSSMADPYASILFQNSTLANRFMLDYGTSNLSDVRLGLFSGNSGAEVYAEKIRLVAATGETIITGAASAGEDLVIDAPGASTSAYLSFSTAGTTRAVIRGSTGGNLVLNPVSGGTYVNWDSGGEFIVGDGGGVEVARITGGGAFDGTGVISRDSAMYIYRSLSSNPMFYSYVTGEANPLHYMDASGAHFWGAGGASALDTKLYRAGISILKTDDSFEVVGALDVSGATTLAAASASSLDVTGGTLGIGATPFDVKSTGNGIGFYNGSSALITKHSGILLSNTYADPDPPSKGIQFGADVKLYWSAANILKTDDVFTAVGNVLAQYDATPTSTVCTTSGTFYAVATPEVSFTPAFTGQRWLVALNMNSYWTGLVVGTMIVRITDSANTTVDDQIIYARGENAASSTFYHNMSGTTVWVAAAGDVGVSRKAKVYLSTNGTSITVTHLVTKLSAYALP